MTEKPLFFSWSETRKLIAHIDRELSDHGNDSRECCCDGCELLRASRALLQVYLRGLVPGPVLLSTRGRRP